MEISPKNKRIIEKIVEILVQENCTVSSAENIFMFLQKYISVTAPVVPVQFSESGDLLFPVGAKTTSD